MKKKPNKKQPAHTWTDREKGIAKQLLEPDVFAFIKKIFTTINVDKTLAGNIALDDSEYGRLMKVEYLTRKNNKDRVNLIAKVSAMGEKKESKTPKIAPK